MTVKLTKIKESGELCKSYEVIDRVTNVRQVEDGKIEITHYFGTEIIDPEKKHIEVFF